MLKIKKIKQTVTKDDFHDAFIRMGRKYHFSYKAINALYDYLEETDKNYELDVIEICCEFTEDTIKNTLKEYNLESLEELEKKTMVIWHDEESVLFVNY